MGLEMGRVDHHRVGRAAVGCQGGEDPVEHPDPAPADEAVVERLRRPVDGGRVPPHQPAPDDMDNAADHPAVINPRHPARLIRQERLQPGELVLGKPEVVVRHHKLPTFGSLNHISGRVGILFMGPEPRPSQVNYYLGSEVALRGRASTVWRWILGISNLLKTTCVLATMI